MRIYVAGPFVRRKEVQEVMVELASRGHHITLDWTELELNEADEDTKAKGSWDIQRQELQAVTRADIVVACDYGHVATGRGMWVEVGYALAQAKEVLVFNMTAEPVHEHVFWHNTYVTVVYGKQAMLSKVEELQDRVEAIRAEQAELVSLKQERLRRGQ